eukprot:1723817-Pyramimonas_sp.AAC.2
MQHSHGRRTAPSVAALSPATSLTFTAITLKMCSAYRAEHAQDGAIARYFRELYDHTSAASEWGVRGKGLFRRRWDFSEAL